MKIKTVSLAFLFSICSYLGISQNGVYIEYTVEGDGIIGAFMPNVLIKEFIKGQTSLTSHETKNGAKSIRLKDSTGLTIYEKSSGNTDCMKDTWENIEQAAKEESDVKIVDINVEKTDEEKTILGHKCKKAIITFKQKSMLSSAASTSNVWFTSDFKVGLVDGMQDPLLDGSKEYCQAISNLGGAALVIETQTEMMGFKMKLTCTCKKIEAKVITDEQLTFDMKDCEKPMTAKKYAKLIKKRRVQQSMNSNHGRGW
jgi:hypothetical protein